MFVNKHNILYSSQYGFRSTHDDILSNFDKGHFTFCLFIDLKKAFDTVNYDILLSKLENYGFRGVVNDWFKSYLIGRRQNTTVNGYISDSHQSLCGVPQGSVLEPLFFLLFINDLYKSSNKLQSTCSPMILTEILKKNLKLRLTKNFSKYARG